MRVVLDRDGTPLVLSRAWVDALGRRIARPVAGAVEGLACRLSREDLGREEVQRGLELSKVDVLALAGAALVIDRGQQCPS